jgi:hypothetical protein
MLAVPQSGARADDLLVMPFACTMVGGRPLLSPAPEQSHRIVGRREQRTFNACSPVNPDLCRSWTVYRFLLDCEGRSVPWVDVVAAIEADQGTGRAWLEGGRLMLRMEPAWHLDPDDPCARRPPWLDRHRMRRYCAERQESDPPGLVEMPAGFAPMLGIDAIFVKAAPGLGAPPPPPVAAAPPPPPIAAAPPAPAAPPPPRAARVDPPQPPRLDPPTSGRIDPARDAAPNAASGKAALQAPLPAPAPKEASAKTPPPPVAPAPSAEPPSAAKPGGPVVPKIINRPDAAADPAPPPAPADVAKSAPAVAQADAKPAASPPPPAKGAARQEPPPAKAAPSEKDQPVTVSLVSVVSSPGTAIAFGFIALTAGLLTMFALARRREYASRAGRRPRDFAAVSLDGRGRRPRPAAPARIADARGALPPSAAASAMHRVPMPGEDPAADSGTPAPFGDQIPRTRAEALQVLGMGVAASANMAALKKIVDGLRLSWHPDLARDEGDRQLRELRLKQINAAWEIIQGKRAEV